MLRVAPVYTAPLANCGTLVCYTTGTASAPNARVVRLDAADRLAARSISAPASNAAASPPSPTATSRRCSGTARPTRSTSALRHRRRAGLVDRARPTRDNHPTDFGIGESRLEFGGGKYGAYYHVHSDSGHEGDTLKFADAASGTQTTTGAGAARTA